MEINSDVGEVSREVDDSILPWISACNVSCGAHAGDENLIRGTVKEAIRLGVNVGAHPSWPDRENFGRLSIKLSTDELKATLREQLETLAAIVGDEGGELSHVKPHGALYHDVVKDSAIADCLIEAMRSIDLVLPIYGLAGSTLENTYREAGIRFIHEGFGDRRYQSRLQLRSRSENDALISNVDDFRQHMETLISGKVIDVNGQTHRLPVETICIHGDSPHASEFAKIAHELTH